MTAIEAWIWRTYATLTSRTWLIIWALVLGALLPSAYVAAPAIRWLVMAMLTLTFLGLTLSRSSLRLSHLWLLLTPPALGLILGFTLRPFGPDVTLAAVLVALTPTATAAPVILGLLGRKADYGAVGVVTSNLAAAITLPAVLAIVAGPATTGASPYKIVLGTLITVFTPLLVAWPIRRLAPAVARWPGRSTLSFALWLAVLFLVSAQTSHFLRESMQPPWWRVFAIAGISFALCMGHFRLGRRLGEPDTRIEAAQCLGQKNTMLTIWIALAWYNPLVAIGPASYVLWHNLYNSIQLGRAPRPPSRS